VKASQQVNNGLMTIRSIPLVVTKEKLKKAHLPQAFEVRGEVILPATAFAKMNEDRVAQGQ
jgi:DNA ligase (NAD+)